jgi:hypothetical protein
VIENPMIFVLAKKLERGIEVPFVVLWSQGYAYMDLLEAEYPGQYVVLEDETWEELKRKAREHFGIA